MEVNEAAKIAIARPVASRPRCPIYKSFSELLAGAINISSTNVNDSELATTAIRPKTVRLKPATNHGLVGEFSPQVDMSGAPEEKPRVLYKPAAKLAPRKSLSLLGEKGCSKPAQRPGIAEVEAHVQSANETKRRNDVMTESQQSALAKSGQDKGKASSKILSENTNEAEQSLISASNTDRPSYDGYNWRKYGQKQVKGSEYPRSYYKCTHLKCPVKKKVERSHDGQIAEIVYRGEHSHPKPQPLKRALVCNDANTPAARNQHHVRMNEVYGSRTENQNDVGLSIHSTYSSKVLCFYDTITTAGMQNFEESQDGMKKPEADCNEPKTKRRKSEGHSNGAGTSGESALPNVSIQNATDSDITEDGFRWRKYGQKVVKGNSYPRSYYKCTTPKCNVRKFVERTMDDPKAVITTYEGKHNHDIPSRRPNSEASKASSKSSVLKNKP